MTTRILTMPLVAALLAAATSAGPVRAADPGVATFTLRDHLNRDWQHELVFFPVDESVFGDEGLVLVDGDAKLVAHQWLPANVAPAKKPSIAFLASVPAPEAGPAIEAVTSKGVACADIGEVKERDFGLRMTIEREVVEVPTFDADEIGKVFAEKSRNGPHR